MGDDNYWVDAEKLPPPSSGDYLCIVGVDYLTRETVLDYSVLQYDADVEGWICRCKVFYWRSLPAMPVERKDKGWSVKEYKQLRRRQIAEMIGMKE